MQFLQFPQRLDKANHPFMKFDAMSWRVTGKTSLAPVSTKSLKGNVILPMPTNGITDSISSNWEETAGAFIAKGGFASDGVGKVKDLAGSAAAAFEFRTGVMMNDYMSLLFKGANFREFNFEFTMVPDNEQEAIAIANIVKFFKNNSLSSHGSVGTRYPSIFRIGVCLPNGKSLFRFKDCVNTNITCNYFADNIYATFVSGHPVKVNMTLDFKELDRQYKNEI